MLRKQKRGAIFSGGIEACRVTPHFVELLQSIRVAEVWLAYDHRRQLRHIKKACDLLSFLPRRKLRCYVLIGFGNDTIEKAQRRLQEAWDAGTLPFAMLYVDDRGWRKDDEWRRFQRKWTRPALMFSAIQPKPFQSSQLQVVVK